MIAQALVRRIPGQPAAAHTPSTPGMGRNAGMTITLNTSETLRCDVKAGFFLDRFHNFAFQGWGASDLLNGVPDSLSWPADVTLPPISCAGANASSRHLKVCWLHI